MQTKTNVVVFGIIFLFSIIFSGCTAPQGHGTTSLVKEFRFTPNTIYDQEVGYLKMVLENDGQFLVKNIYVLVYGLGNDWGILDVFGEKTRKVPPEGFNLDIDANFKADKQIQIGDSNIIINGNVDINNIENILKGENPDINIYDVDVFILRKDISVMIELDKFLQLGKSNNYQRVADIDMEQVFKKATKLPPIYIDYLLPAINQPGERLEIYWKVKPPSLPPNTKTRATANARVCYETVNRLNGKLTLVSENEFLSKYTNTNVRKKSLTSYGPVTITLETKDPIILNNDNIVVLTLKLTNQGKGKITSESCKQVMQIDHEKRDILQVNKLNVKIEGLICNIQEDNIVLIPGQTTTLHVFCQTDPTTMPITQQDVDVEISYTYYEDVSATITVENTI